MHKNRMTLYQPCLACCRWCYVGVRCYEMYWFFISCH